MTKKTPFSYYSDVTGITETILADIKSLSKPLRKFLLIIYTQWWSVSGRYNFINMARYLRYSEQTLRNGYSRGFDFPQFNISLVKQHCSCETILAYDPTFIRKSGKHTEGSDYFWSGMEQRAKKGLEIGCLAAVDIKNETAFHLSALQTPASVERKDKKMSLIDHYREHVLSVLPSLGGISRYMAVDGYFMKKEFILPVVKAGLHIITKMRSDGNLKYLYKGEQKKGKGRKRKHDGKVNLKNIDKRRWSKFHETKEEEYYTAALYCVALKMDVRVVYLFKKKSKGYEVFLSTAITLAPEKIVKYYRMRYQIEFLIRDGKGHSGLEDCQARDKEKLNFHFNISLTNINIAKVAYYLPIPKARRKAFSLQDIKRFYHTKFVADTIFSNLGLDLSCKKIKRIYLHCLDVGRMAA